MCAALWKRAPSLAVCCRRMACIAAVLSCQVVGDPCDSEHDFGKFFACVAVSHFACYIACAALQLCLLSVRVSIAGAVCDCPRMNGAGARSDHAPASRPWISLCQISAWNPGCFVYKSENARVSYTCTFDFTRGALRPRITPAPTYDIFQRGVADQISPT
jgi:hypothetical protein